MCSTQYTVAKYLNFLKIADFPSFESVAETLNRREFDGLPSLFIVRVSLGSLWDK